MVDYKRSWEESILLIIIHKQDDERCTATSYIFLTVDWRIKQNNKKLCKNERKRTYQKTGNEFIKKQSEEMEIN